MIATIGMKLKTIELLPSDSRIVLKESVRRKLFYDKKLSAKKLGLSTKTIGNWLRADYRPSLKQLSDFGINVSDDGFFEKIDSVGISKSNRKLYLPPSINLHKVSWLIGVMEGDRAGEKEISVGLTNENPALIKNFLDSLVELNMNRDEVKIKVQITTGSEFDINSISKEFHVPIKNISVSESDIPRKRPVIQILANRKILAQILLKIRNMILLGKADRKSVREFIKGFCDAEGSVNVSKRTIEIKQKNTIEGRGIMEFVSNSLNLFGIKNTMNGPNSENMLVVRLAGGKKNASNLKKFYTFVGFSSKEKSEKLKRILL